MKKHNLFKVVMLTIAFVVLLSWLLPITYYSTSGLVEDARTQIGLFTVMNYLGIAIQYFSHIGLYVLIIGGFYGVLHKISGYRNLLDKVVSGFKDREWIFMTVIMVVFAILSAMAGLSLPLMFLFPFVISVLLLMGYDKITAAMVTAGSTVIGLIGSVFSTANTEGIDIVIGTTPDGDALSKILLLVIALALLIYNVLSYSKKHRNSKPTVDNGFVPEVSANKKQKVWPIVAIVDFMVLILILAFVSWDLFDITFFTKSFNNVMSYELFGFPIFSTIFGLESPFGSWTLTEFSVVILVFSWLISFIYKVKFSDYITYFMNGAKRALKPAVLVVLLYIVLIATTYVPTILTALKPLLTSTSGLNIFIMAIVAFVTCVFSVELYYGATSVLPYVTGALFTGLVAKDITILSLIWQSMYGVAMLVAPTSVVLMATLSYLHIPYQNWLKNIWKLLLELVVVLLIVFTIMSFM